jgi:hypothetical protein
VKTNDGGPAFPLYIKEGPREYDYNTGMTLRDWFAGMALHIEWSGRPSDADSPTTCDRMAENAYRIADAMLKARDEGAV